MQDLENFYHYTGFYNVTVGHIIMIIVAMTDFSTLISNSKLVLLGAAAQIGIFLTFFGAIALAFDTGAAGAIAIIGGADGPTAIFLSSLACPEPDRPHCHCGLFVYGAGPGNPAADYAVADKRQRAPNPYETAARRFQN